MSSTDTVTSQLAINQLNAVYFVNHDLADLATLLAGVPQGAEVVLLDPTQDGLSQMLTALDGRSGLDAIHLIGHGASGLIDLGSASVTTDANGNTTVNNNGTGTSIVPNPSTDSTVNTTGSGDTTVSHPGATVTLNNTGTAR